MLLGGLDYCFSGELKYKKGKGEMIICSYIISDRYS